MKLLTFSVLAKLDDNIDTDVMSPVKYMTSYEPSYLGTIALKDLDPDFTTKMAPGGILVAGSNFGCGSSRETAPIALKAAGTKLILAEEFARIFYRNALNIGMPCIVCPGIHDSANIGDKLEVDLSGGTVHNLTSGKILQGTPIPLELMEQFEAGGLMELLQNKFLKR